MLNSVEMWSYWYHESPEYLQKGINGSYIFFHFLSRVVETAPDQYSGTNREYYYSCSDGTFHSRFHHWDGGNFTAEHCYNDEDVSVDYMIKVLEQDRRSTLKNDLSPQDMQTVEASFARIKELMLMLADGRISGSDA